MLDLLLCIAGFIYIQHIYKIGTQIWWLYSVISNSKHLLLHCNKVAKEYKQEEKNKPIKHMATNMSRRRFSDQQIQLLEFETDSPKLRMKQHVAYRLENITSETEDQYNFLHPVSPSPMLTTTTTTTIFPESRIWQQPAPISHIHHHRISTATINISSKSSIS